MKTPPVMSWSVRLELIWSVLCGDWNLVRQMSSNGRTELTLRSRLSKEEFKIE